MLRFGGIYSGGGGESRGRTALPIRKASLFARGRKRDSEEIILLKMADLGGGQHPVRAVRSKQLTRRAFWADPTIHYLGQVAVESREGIEELTIDQARILGGPDRRPAQGENVEFFLSQIKFFNQFNCLKSSQQ